MPNLMSQPNRPLPETLLDDLRELLAWDNNCLLVWASSDAVSDPEGARWFRVHLRSDGTSFGLRLEFWIPEWMNARGVAAILPAHLEVAECEPGRQAAVDLGMGPWRAIETGLPRTARTCARLINELWGRTESDGVLLRTVEYDSDPAPVRFKDVPGYGE